MTDPAGLRRGLRPRHARRSRTSARRGSQLLRGLVRRPPRPTRRCSSRTRSSWPPSTPPGARRCAPCWPRASTSAASSSTRTTTRPRAATWAADPRAALVFVWLAQQRQVRLTGTVDAGVRAPRPRPTSPRGRASRSSGRGPRRSRRSSTRGPRSTSSYAEAERALRRRRRSPRRRAGAASCSRRTPSSSGRAAPAGCTTASGSAATTTAAWVRERLARVTRPVDSPCHRRPGPGAGTGAGPHAARAAAPARRRHPAAAGPGRTAGC